MARQSADRDDLYEELKHAPLRWEIERPAAGTIVVSGIRADGRFMLYLTPELVFQFDNEHRLLRAFENGDLYRTQGTTLARLRRENHTAETTLWRYDLSPHELATFLESMRRQLQQLSAEIADGQVMLLRTTAPGPDPTQLLQARVDNCLRVFPQLAPAFRTRR